MNRNLIITALATAAAGFTSTATGLPYSTGFESAQGYTNGSQFFAHADWSGNGQDESGFTITNSTVGGYTRISLWATNETAILGCPPLPGAFPACW